MCKYCESGRDRDWMIVEDIDFGVFGKGSILAGVSGVDFYDDDPEMVTWIDFGECDSDFSASVKINYCPMCGRKLREVDECQ